MNGQFSQYLQWIQPRKIENGYRYSLQAEIQEELHSSNGKHIRCKTLGESWDKVWYETINEAMGNCSVPWTMNNSNICNNNDEIEKAFVNYREIVTVSSIKGPFMRICDIFF